MKTGVIASFFNTMCRGVFFPEQDGVCKKIRQRTDKGALCLYQASNGTLWTIETLGDFDELHSAFYSDLNTPRWLQTLTESNGKDTRISALAAADQERITAIIKRLHMMDTFSSTPKWLSALNDREEQGFYLKLAMLLAVPIAAAALYMQKEDTSNTLYYYDLYLTKMSEPKPAPLPQTNMANIQAECRAEAYQALQYSANNLTQDAINAQIGRCIMAQLPTIRGNLRDEENIEDVRQKAKDLNAYLETNQTLLKPTVAIALLLACLALQDSLTPRYRANREHLLKKRWATAPAIVAHRNIVDPS